ncbi:MAG: hypothetical protein R3C44_14380 [Chloroflexota bacterium]
MMLDRTGLLDEIGRDRVFWSADRAILSLGADLPSDGPEPLESGEDTLDETLAVTPHEDRADQAL